MNPSVLHVYRTYFPDPPGGLQEAVRQVALATSALGIRNTIFTLSPQPTPPVLQRPEGTVVRCRSWAAPASCDLGDVCAFTRFASLARQSDVIHQFHPWPFADILSLIVRPNPPLVLTYIADIVRQRWLGAAYAPLMWRTLHRARVIVANAPQYAETSPILSRRSFRGKVRVIPLGIDEQSYPDKGDPAVFARIGLEGDQPFILFIGVLRYYKGVEFLLRAAKGFAGTIVVAGTGPEGDRLRQLASELALKNVIFAGQVTNAEKVALLERCQALVLPSHLRAEAFGMVLVEASMFGRPMISCDIGTGTSYVNIHEQTGMVVAPGSPGALLQAMNALSNNPEAAAALGKAARARYELHFSGPALGRAYSALFRELD